MAKISRDVLGIAPPSNSLASNSYASNDFSGEDAISHSTNLSAAEYSELEEEKERLLLVAARDEIARRKKEWGIKYFTPNRPQLKALKSNAKVVAYVGGNRAGKSTAGAAFLAMLLAKHYPSCSCHGEWLSQEKRFDRPLKALVVATSFLKIEEVIEPKLLSLLPKELIASTHRGGMNYLRRVKLKNGGVISCLSGDQDEMEFESADWDVAWIDEPISLARHTAITRGLLDRNGIMILTFTPKIEPWMKEVFIDKADGKRIDVIEADTYENTADIHGEKILSKELIKEWEDSIPEDERDTRVHGKFFFLRGLVYKNFSDVHQVICNHSETTEEGCSFHYKYPNPVICVLDPHDRNPHHVIWAYLDRDDDVIVDHELIIHCELDDLAKKITNTEKALGYKMRKRIIDPNFGRKPAKVGARLSVMQELARNGCSFYEANDNIELGHMIVRDYLHWDSSKPVTAVNKPKLYFSKERVPQTIRSMRNYQYGEWKGSTKDERDLKEHSKDKDTHGSDCVRYLLIGRPAFHRLTEDISNYELAVAPY